MGSPIFEIRNFGWHCTTSAKQQKLETRIRIAAYIPILGSCIAYWSLFDKRFTDATQGLSFCSKGVYYFRWGVSLLSAGIVWLPFDLLATLIRVVASAVFSCCFPKEARNEGYYSGQ